jgi:peptidoglycan/xylan/chitin deacetylase (PgdA/CDA1 family)
MRKSSRWSSLPTNPLFARTRNAAVGLCALAAASAGLSANQIPILLYGQIGDVSHNEYWVTTDTFTRHMQGLKDRGFTTITPEQLLAIRNGTMTAPEKPILLTFTNGYDNVRTIVDPILQQHGFRATAMILPGRVGTTSAWDTGDSGPNVPHLTWAQLNQLRQNGRWSFGSHTMTHARLPDLSDAQAQAEITNSRTEIQSQLGVQPIAFSYPYGDAMPKYQQMAQNAGYSMAFGVRSKPGVTVSHDNIWALPRFDIDNSVTVAQLFGPSILNDASSGTFHPADANQDWSITINEVTAFGAKWRQGQADLANVTRAGFLWRSGGAYEHDPAGSGAQQWRPRSN